MSENPERPGGRLKEVPKEESIEDLQKGLTQTRRTARRLLMELEEQDRELGKLEKALKQAARNERDAGEIIEAQALTIRRLKDKVEELRSKNAALEITVARHEASAA